MNKVLTGLEEMREQAAILKRKLDGEAIVSDRLMRRVMSDKVGSVRRYTLRVSLIGVAAMVLMYYDFAVLFPLSHAFVAATEAMLLCAVVFTVVNRRLLSAADMTGGNLLQASRNLMRFRKRELRYLYIAAPLLLAWSVWIIIELRAHISRPLDADILCVSVGIGVVLGACAGFGMFRRMLRNVNDVIEQIEELTTPPDGRD